MESPEKKPHKKKSIKSDVSGSASGDHKDNVDGDFTISDNGSSSSEESAYANDDAMDSDIPFPLFLPENPSQSTQRETTAVQTISNNLAKGVARTPIPSLPPAVPAQPDFLIPRQPYPPFPLRYPNKKPTPDTTSVERQTVPKKRPSDTDENQLSRPLLNGVNSDARPHKKAKNPSNPPIVVGSVGTRETHASGSSNSDPTLLSKSTLTPTPAPNAGCKVCKDAHTDGACLVEERNKMQAYRSMIVNEPGDESREDHVGAI